MTDNASPHSLLESRTMLDVRKLTALLIVEPDPETWLPTEQAIGQAGLLLDELNQAFAAQVDLYPRLWPGTANDDEGLFGAEGRFTPVHPHSTVPVTDDSDLWIFLRELLIGIARRQPQTVFGLLGAMREDEIQRVAEAVAGCGLRAVVLEPLCLSLALFRDVDALVADADRQQGARRVLTGEDYSPLDDGLENGEEPETGDDDRLE